MIEKVLFLRSNDVTNNEAKLPSSNQIDLGELAINYADGHETIAILNDNDEVVPFSSDEQVKEWISNAITGATETDPIFTASPAHDITAQNISNWNSKQDAIDDLANIRASAITGAGKISNVQSDWNATTGDAVILNKPTIPSVDNYFDGAEYVSTAKTIIFKHGTTTKATIDATDFIKDGMVDTVSISNSNLVITFNTDAGKEDIEIPLASIFNPNNYYTKNESDAKFTTSTSVEEQITSKGYITGYTETDPTVPSWAKESTKPQYTASEVGALPTGTTLDGIADGTTRKLSDYAKQTDFASVSAVTTGHTANTTIHVTTAEKNTWNNKQNAISDLETIRTNAASGYSAYQTVTAHTGNTLMHLPTISSSDNGKILQVVNGAWALITPITVYSGSNSPDNSLGNDGDIYLQKS